jgi:hypothetical protein
MRTAACDASQLISGSRGPAGFPSLTHLNIYFVECTLPLRLSFTTDDSIDCWLLYFELIPQRFCYCTVIIVFAPHLSVPQPIAHWPAHDISLSAALSSYDHTKVNLTHPIHCPSLGYSARSLQRHSFGLHLAPSLQLVLVKVHSYFYL